MDEQVKQKFKKMLEYQKKDIELRKLNNVLERDEALAGMNRSKRTFNDAKQTIADCEQQAGGLLDLFNELQKYVDENESALAELEGVDDASEEELEKRVRKLESLKSKFQSADKKMHDIEDKSKAVCTRRDDAFKSGRSAQAKFKEFKDKHEVLVKSKSAEMNKLKAELDAKREGLDPEIYGEYVKLVEDNKFPPIVPAAADEKKNMFNCGGCGLNLPQKGNAMLNERGWFRCENCRRIVVLLD